MPRIPNPDETTLLEDQVITAFTKTTPEERTYIAESWVINYKIDLTDISKRSGLPPIAIKIASLIDADHPLLVSPGRGVMYSAMGCAIIIIGIQITEFPLNSPECEELIAKLTKKKPHSLVRVKKKTGIKVVPVACG